MGYKRNYATDLERTVGPRHVGGDPVRFNVLLQAAFVTLEACGPFGPWVISNST
jgi:hypothetical protein